MNERTIQIRLMEEVLSNKNHKAAITNSTMLLYNEADLLSVTKAGLVHEYEIKLTKSDYNREFKKKKSKHWYLKNAKRFGDSRIVANYFWFVTYDFDIEPPEYAGWIKLTPVVGVDWLRLWRKKQAPRIHGNRWDDAKVARIARLLSFRLLKEYKDGNGTN